MSSRDLLVASPQEQLIVYPDRGSLAPLGIEQDKVQQTQGNWQWFHDLLGVSKGQIHSGQVCLHSGKKEGPYIFEEVLRSKYISILTGVLFHRGSNEVVE